MLDLVFVFIPNRYLYQAGDVKKPWRPSWKDLPPLVHPRHPETAPRWLGTYAREEKLMSWKEAIRKLSSLPADIFGFKDRGHQPAVSDQPRHGNERKDANTQRGLKV
jgi:hypothetical protein